MILTPKNWTEFQHYKDRAPTWIKLHKALLDNYEFSCLPVVSKALAPLLWLLASEYEDGIIDASLDKLAFRLHMTRGDFADALSPLIQAGFFDASEPLADRYQDASLEREREKEKQVEKEEERETRASALSSVDPSDFDAFWDEWPNKVGKPAALRAFNAAIKRGACLEEILQGLRSYIRDKPPDRPWLNPATFLNQERWKDQPASIAKPLTEHQTRRKQTEGILHDLENFASRGRFGGQGNPQLLSGHPGERPPEICGGVGGKLIDVSPGSRRESG